MLPKARCVQAALRLTTERLAAELARPGSDAPAWSDFEWRTAMAVTVMHGIGGLLAGRLRWQGPPAWRGFLTEQAEHGRRREQGIRMLLADLDLRTREAGLPLLAMKGSALLQLGLYAPGERPMSDVDLLARQSHAIAADAVILAAGYARGVCKDRHTAYEPLEQPTDRAFGEHERNPIQIELHAAVREPLPVREIDITADLLRPGCEPGLNAYASLPALMRHLLLHAAGNLCNGNVRLIQLHDIAVLAARLDSGDWDEALAPASDGRAAWWAVAPLQLAQRLFPGCVPQTSALARSQAACTVWLRQVSNRHRLADVSLSRLGIPMLPGLAWSRSPGEALALAWQRVHPVREAAEVSSQHALAGTAWPQQPPWRKALACLLGRAPRVQTMYSLHRALAYRPSSSA